MSQHHWGHEDDYGKEMFARTDFERLATILRGIKGRFTLSLNDRPEARKLFQWARIETVETRYSANLRATR